MDFSSGWDIVRERERRHANTPNALAALQPHISKPEEDLQDRPSFVHLKPADLRCPIKQTPHPLHLNQGKNSP